MGWLNRTLAIVLATVGAAAVAAPLVVIDARGALKPGQRIDSARPLQLKEGERVTVIAADGRTVTLRGPFSGLPLGRTPVASDPRQAFAALMANRKARTSSVGVVRSGDAAAALPDPWLIDVSRAGDRCVRAGTRPVWWRPERANAQPFTVSPIDRSWRADFKWAAGQDRMAAPALGKAEPQTTMLVKSGDQEWVIRLNEVPTDLDNDFMLVSWLLEKGCLQQADALMRSVEAAAPGAAPATTPAAPGPATPTAGRR